MKKGLFFLLATMGLTTAHADNYDYPYLTLQQSDGTLQSVSVESLVLTISDGKLLVTNTDGSQTFTLTALSQMHFSATDETGNTDDSGQATSIINAPTTLTAPVEVYTLSGISLGTFENIPQAQATLQRGIYVVKSGSQTLKIAVK